MTLEELKSLREGEVVVLTKVDEKTTLMYPYSTEMNQNFAVGDEMIFYKFCVGSVDFLRNSITISHFSYDIYHYIERKVELRDRKLNELGI